MSEVRAVGGNQSACRFGTRLECVRKQTGGCWLWVCHLPCLIWVLWDVLEASLFRPFRTAYAGGRAGQSESARPLLSKALPVTRPRARDCLLCPCTIRARNS